MLFVFDFQIILKQEWSCDGMCAFDMFNIYCNLFYVRDIRCAFLLQSTSDFRNFYRHRYNASLHIFLNPIILALIFTTRKQLRHLNSIKQQVSYLCSISISVVLVNLCLKFTSIIMNTAVFILLSTFEILFGLSKLS